VSADEWAVDEIKAFRLTHGCNQSGCPNTLAITMTGSQQAANAAKKNPPPNVKGWVDGFCPDHTPSS